jgi:hypothetical protein
MPSTARRALTNNLTDVTRHLQLHAEAGSDGPGRRRGLEALNKSAIVLLTSYWEAYCEDIAEEGIEHIVKYAKSANALPKAMKRLIAKELKEDKNDLAAWSLADDSWRQLLVSRLDQYRASGKWNFNTPKPAQIDELFLDGLGIDRISDTWAWDKTKASNSRDRLKSFVELTGPSRTEGKAMRALKNQTPPTTLSLSRSLPPKQVAR